MRDARRRAYLTALPGVGRKTAACVLLFSYGLRGASVDTHVSRVGMRLHLLRARRALRPPARGVLAITPAGAELEFHVNLLRHGRRTCHPQRPACRVCALQADVPVAARLAAATWSGTWSSTKCPRAPRAAVPAGRRRPGAGALVGEPEAVHTSPRHGGQEYPGEARRAHLSRARRSQQGLRPAGPPRVEDVEIERVARARRRAQRMVLRRGRARALGSTDHLRALRGCVAGVGGGASRPGWRPSAERADITSCAGRTTVSRSPPSASCPPSQGRASAATCSPTRCAEGFEVGPARLGLHTCTLPRGPRALPNYRARGLRPFRTQTL